MRLNDVILLLRPRQWTKNLAVFAGIVFSGNLGNPTLLAKVVLAFVALDLVSSGFYAVNDARDAEQDRLHPIKKNRPVAAGRIAPAQAVGIAVALLVAGAALSAFLGWPFLASMAGFALVQALYQWKLKDIAIVDMLAIAMNFVIRAVAGAEVVAVDVSPWLILCTGLLALFLASGKRRHEVVLLEGVSGVHRPVLLEYSAKLLDSFMVTLSAATVTAYALYTFFEARAPMYSMMLTIPFVIYGVLRYQSLVLMKEGGGRPEEVLLTDRPMLACLGLWIASAVFALYVLPPLMG